MITRRMLASLGLVIAVAATSTSATMLTLTLEGEGKGSLAGEPFSTSHFVFTAKADTANRQSRSYGWWITDTSASTSIAGLGDFDLLSGTGIFVGQGTGVVGFCRSPVGSNLFYGPINPAFRAWDMLTPIGPVSGQASFASWQSSGGFLINTTGGILLFDDGSTTMTFTAIPEPATLSLLTLGGLAMLRRRRRQGLL